MKNKIIIAMIVSLSVVFTYIGIQQYLEKKDMLTEIQQDDNVVIQKVETGSACASNAHCSSGNCQIGVCEPCSDFLCNNDGQCCTEYNKGCINAVCSNGDNGYPCNGDQDCNSLNCYSGFCIDCLKVAMLCESDSQCCSPMNCLDGACFETLPFGRACTKDSECHSGICVNNTCSCADISCACDSNDDPSTCNSLNCYGGLCQHKDDGAAIVAGSTIGAAVGAGLIGAGALASGSVATAATGFDEMAMEISFDFDWEVAVEMIEDAFAEAVYYAEMVGEWVGGMLESMGASAEVIEVGTEASEAITLAAEVAPK